MCSIENFLGNNDIKSAIEECNKEKLHSIEYLLKVIHGLPCEKPRHVKKITVKPVCNWASSKQLCDQWNKMSKGNYTWGNIQLVWEDTFDFLVIINFSQEHIFMCPEKTILMEMSPGAENVWKSVNISFDKYIKTISHKSGYSNIEWTLDYSYNKLTNMQIVKTENLSIILPSTYQDPGKIKLVDFARYCIKNNVPIDIFGSSKWCTENYKKDVTPNTSDDALFPYNYTIAIEDKSIKNYVSEKLINGILAECLVFYSGCYNIREYIDEKAFVYLEFSNPEKDSKTISNAILNNLREERLPYIRAAKQKILNQLQFFPRIENILTEHIEKKI